MGRVGEDEPAGKSEITSDQNRGSELWPFPIPWHALNAQYRSASRLPHCFHH